ncbi:MAG: GNAT family N-acetyltransferase [bacterium]
MSNVGIKTVSTKKDLQNFIKLEWDIYKNDPYWVPHLLMERKKILGRKDNPFFLHGDMEYFLAYKNEILVGRIAAIKNDVHNQTHNDKVGFFGFFECINDQEVANRLFDSAKEWLCKNKLTEMRGPASPSSNDEYALLVEGFDDSPRFLMSYNPKYYIDLIEGYGFKKAKDLYAWKIENEKMNTSEKIKRVADLTKQRYGLKIRHINMKDFKNDVEKVKIIYRAAWEPNWGFVPPTDIEMDYFAKDLKSLVDPDLVLFGEIDNKTVGFALVMPDINAIIKGLNGRLFPFGFLKFYTQKKKIKWARIVMLGILPEYQRKGIDGAMYHEIVNVAASKNIFLGEASWVLEDNDMMNKAAMTMNASIYKKYRIYEMPI